MKKASKVYSLEAFTYQTRKVAKLKAFALIINPSHLNIDGFRRMKYIEHN